MNKGDPMDNAVAAKDNRLTQQVIDSFANTPSPRLREIMTSLITHLHSFAREVNLTEKEWEVAVQFLRETGDWTSDRRQEFILLSDVLGLSMTVVETNAPKDPRVTESTVFGPFFIEGSPEVANGGALPGGAPGIPLFISGTVTSVEGDPIPGALIEVWEADQQGRYDVEYLELGCAGRGHLYSDQLGRYSLWCIKPSYYSIPTDGPVGRLLFSCNRSPMRPAHVHFKISAQGYKTLVTHIFEKGDPYIDSDAVFGVKSSLIREFAHHTGQMPENSPVTANEWFETEFSPILQKVDS